MAAKELPEYKKWEELVATNKEHWQYLLNLYSYALQKPARSLFTSYLYPGWYQGRLLNREFASAMQVVGDVLPEELKEFQRLTHDPQVARTYRFFKAGLWWPSRFWNLPGFALGGTLTFSALLIGKPTVWCFVPGIMVYLATLGIENSYHKSRLGTLVDLANWTAEKRKAAIWLAERKQVHKNSLLTLAEAEQQLVALVTKSRD